MFHKVPPRVVPRGIRLLIPWAVALFAVALLAPAAHADVRTIAVDTLRTSWDSDETKLTPATVASANFGQLFSVPVDGQVYAQPLVLGDRVVAATENNKVYGLNKENGTQLWKKDLGPAWPAANVSCGDLVPNIGVTATPVYDPATDSIYLTSKTNDTGDADHPHWYMHALDPATGAERPGWPVSIEGAPTNDPTRPFTPRTAMQRPGLLLLDGVVYAGFASHCDTSPFVGYVVGVSTAEKKLRTMWATESGNAYAEGGIWQSGGGLVSDGPGRIIVTTGNGISPVAGPGNKPPSTLAESVVTLQVQPDGSLKATDFFSPSDNARLDQDDWDLGSGAPLAIPDGFGTTEHPHLLVQVGKDGRVYLLDRDDLGGMAQGANGGDKVLDIAGPYNGVWGKPGFFGGSSGGYVYTVENLGKLRAYKIVKGSNGSVRLSAVGASSATFGYTSGSPVITSNGGDSSSALVWVTAANLANGELRAYSAVPDGNGTLVQRRSFPIGRAAKFSSVATDNGRVYVGTRDASSAEAAKGRVFGFGAPTTSAFKIDATTLPDTEVNSTGEATLTVTANRNVTLAGAATEAPFTIVSSPLTERDPGTGEPVSTTFAKNATFRVTVSYAPQAPGQLSGVLNLTTADGEEVDLDLHGLATKPGIVASPGTLDFDEVPTGSLARQSVTVTNTGTHDFTISGLPQAPAGFTVSPSWDGGSTVLPPQGSVGFSVTYSPTAAGDLTDVITVPGTLAPEDGGGPVSLEVPLTATAVQGAPHLTLPPTLDFGQVAVGMSKTLQFKIENTGNVALKITKAKAPAGIFSTADPFDENVTIPPGESMYQTVTFKPTAFGTVSGPTYFYLFTGDDGRGEQKVMLTGQGVDDPISVKFEQMGGASWGNKNPLGQAISGQYPVPGGLAQDFVNGGIYWSKATGAHAVSGSNAKKYKELGGPAGILGFPLTDELGTPDRVGRFNHFSRDASIYWTPQTGAHAIGGAIRAKWAQLGWENGLGYPTTDELGTPDRVGRFNHFTRDASIYWSPGSGAHSVGGAIRARWGQLGWERGLGYPLTDEYAVAGGRREMFQRGMLTWNARTGAVTKG